MPVVICETCGTLFQKANSHGCPKCQEKMESSIGYQLHQYVSTHSDVSMDELASQFGISRQELEKIIFHDAANLFMSYIPVYCGMCQRKVLSKEVSRNNVLCSDCQVIFKKQVEAEKITRNYAPQGEELATCLLCGHDYVKRHSKLCGWCQNICMDIYRYIHRNPGITLDAIAQEFQLKKRLINAMLMYGDMGTAADMIRMSCVMCETELTQKNRQGKVCCDCYSKLKSVLPSDGADGPEAAAKRQSAKTTSSKSTNGTYTLSASADTAASSREKHFGLKRRR